jgi:hypothetical protein
MRDAFSLGVCLLLTHAVVVGVIRFIRPSVQPAGSPSSLSASVERLAHIERLIGSLDERLQHLDDQLDVMDRRLRRGLVQRSAATAAMVNAQPVNAEIPAVVPTRMPRSSHASGASPWLTSLLEDMQQNPKPSAVRFVAAADEGPAVASSTSSKMQQPSAGIAAAATTPVLVPDGSTSQPLAKKPPAVASRKKPKPIKEEDWEAEWEKEDKAERVQDSSSRSGTSKWGSNSLLEELAKLLGQQPGSKAKSKRRKAGKVKGKAKPGALTAGGDAAGEERDDDFVIQDVPE